MEKQLLTNEEIKERIEVLEEWINKGTYTEMIGTAVNETLYYVNLLAQLEDSEELQIVNECPTQIYQQIGIVI